MTQILSMETDEAVVDVLPLIGGGLAAFDLKVGGERLPILRRWDGRSEAPRALASAPMVPWFNRISGGGFSFGGKFYPIAPNDPVEPVPIHGDGWHSAWEIAEQIPARITLTLRSRAIPPFDYEARQVFELAGATLTQELSVKHRGLRAIPYGLGLHPWFPRTPATTLQARATGIWLEQPPEFPAKATPEPVPAKWDFSAPRRLPDAFIDNGFAGWDGRARIAWADRGAAVEIEADSAIRLFHVYSLNADCPFFCFEPVTHANNAYGKPGTPQQNALRVLAPAEETGMRVSFRAVRG